MIDRHSTLPITLFNFNRHLPSNQLFSLFSLSLSLSLSLSIIICPRLYIIFYYSYHSTFLIPNPSIAKFSEVMAEEEPKTVEPTPCSTDAPPAEPPKDVAEEKAVIPPPLPPAEDKPDDTKALAIVETKEPEAEKTEGSINRDAVLARVATEKRLSLIKAWEESEKSKAENKAQKKLSSVLAWENSKKASLEAELKKIEEQLEKSKAEYIEKTKNKIALVHKAAEEKRAIIEAKRGEDLLKADEISAKYRATGTGPKKLLGCF